MTSEVKKLRLPFFFQKRRITDRQEQTVKRVSRLMHDVEEGLADIDTDDLAWENEFDPNKTPDGRGRGKR